MTITAAIKNKYDAADLIKSATYVRRWHIVYFKLYNLETECHKSNMKKINTFCRNQKSKRKIDR